MEGFAHAAEYAERAGFDGVEIHAAHGYLLSQFLSPSTNHRSDEYGGSLKHRMQLIVEVKEAISRRVRKDFIVGIKINSVEFQDEGFRTDEAAELCETLENQNFDFVELSGGTHEKMPTDSQESTRLREAVSFEKLTPPAFGVS